MHVSPNSNYTNNEQTMLMLAKNLIALFITMVNENALACILLEKCTIGLIYEAVLIANYV